jgi:hypothetical protein
MISVNTPARSRPLRGWFFQRYRKPLSPIASYRPPSSRSRATETLHRQEFADLQVPTVLQPLSMRVILFLHGSASQ